MKSFVPLKNVIINIILTVLLTIMSQLNQCYVSQNETILRISCKTPSFTEKVVKLIVDKVRHCNEMVYLKQPITYQPINHQPKLAKPMVLQVSLKYIIKSAIYLRYTLAFNLS